MDILLIGNGFDLAHNLPTKYLDFLEFVKVIKQILEIRDGDDVANIYWGNISIQVKELIQSNMENVRNNLFSQRDMWKDLIGDNFWIEYFLQCNMHGKENWIDFESEIFNIIKSLDKDMHSSGKNLNLYDEIEKYFTNEFLEFYEKIRECETFKEVRDILEKDLKSLIRALEIYLTEFVEPLECKIMSPDIKEAIEKGNKYVIKGIEVYICNIICFNYTNTYERFYLESNITKNLIDYVHGKADINNTIESNNMVLGIDEYLGKKKRNKHVEFISFKKFYQRIHKQTGCKYKEWVDKIRDDRKEVEDKFGNSPSLRLPFNVYNSKNRGHYLYIFGHSLDVTDKDILRDLILNDNVYTTIFYHDKDTMGKQIANLVKVIGQDELIRRTGGSTKTIEFKLQKPMEEIVKK